MRCHRCHSKIDPGRKMCPVCGTLIKKPRGAFSVTRQAGGNAFGDISYSLSRFFDSVNIKIVLAAVCGVILAAVVMTTFRCGSCDVSGGFSSCGTPSSCSALDGITGSCESCGGLSCRGRSGCSVSSGDVSSGDISQSDLSSADASVPAGTSPGGGSGDGGEKPEKDKNDGRKKPSLSSVQAGTQGNSCAGGNRDEEEAPVYESSRNSAVNGREFLYLDRLYFCGSSGIYYINDRDETGMLLKGGGINSLYIDNGRAYYLKTGELWTAPLESPEAGELLVSAGEGADGTVSERVYGFGMSGQTLCWWRSDGTGSFDIASRVTGDGTDKALYSGRCAQQQVYRGYVYFVSREEEDLNTLYRIPLEGGEKQELIKLPVGYFTLCGGYIFAYTWIDGEADLYKIDCNTLRIASRWDFRSIRGMTADDYSVYYYSNDADGTGSVFRVLPDGTGNTLLFSDSSVIQLNHVAGKYFSLYTDIDESGDNRFASASYLIVDSETGDKRPVR